MMKLFTNPRNKHWIFNWYEGGFNTAWGEDEDEAYDNAVRESILTGIMLKPLSQTFRLFTDTEYESLLRDWD